MTTTTPLPLSNDANVSICIGIPDAKDDTERAYGVELRREDLKFVHITHAHEFENNIHDLLPPRKHTRMKYACVALWFVGAISELG